MNKYQKKEVESFAKSQGFKWNDDHSKMVNSSGDSIKQSSSGGSYNFNGTTYNSSYDIKNSAHNKKK